jgi:hypothetical protein
MTEQERYRISLSIMLMLCSFMPGTCPDGRRPLSVPHWRNV